MPFSLDKPLCPTCCEPPEGTVEVLTGLAEVFILGAGLFDYGGYTRIDWNAQKTRQRAGKVLLECGHHHQWWSVLRHVPSPTKRTGQGTLR